MNTIKNTAIDLFTTDIYKIHPFMKSIKINIEALDVVVLHFPSWESIYYHVEQEYRNFTRDNSPDMCHCGSFDCGGDHGECICGAFYCNESHM